MVRRDQAAGGEPDSHDPTREAILQAALTAFGREGLKAASLSQIALAAKVSRPTLYARYPDKAHLYRAVLERECEAALAASREAAEMPGSFEEVLRGMLIGYYGSLYESVRGLPKMEILVYAEQTEDVIVRTRAEFRKGLRRMIQQQIDQGGIDKGRIGMSIPRLVDQICLTPQALKAVSPTPARHRRDLSDYARLMAQALAPKDRA